MTRTQEIDIPDIDYNCLESIRKIEIQHTCECGLCYHIRVYNGLSLSYGEVESIVGGPDSIFVQEIPDFRYGRDTIAIDTFSSYTRIESIVSHIESFPTGERNHLYLLLLSNLVSIMDSFIKIYTEPIVLSNKNFVERFAVDFGIKAKDTEGLRREIMDKYRNSSFQSISIQKVLFQKVLGLDFKFDKELEYIIKLRNIIIHRNTIDANGFIHKISKQQLLKAIEIVENHTTLIFEKLRELEFNNLLK